MVIKVEDEYKRIRVLDMRAQHSSLLRKMFFSDDDLELSLTIEELLKNEMVKPQAVFIRGNTRSVMSKGIANVEDFFGLKVGRKAQKIVDQADLLFESNSNRLGCSIEYSVERKKMGSVITGGRVAEFILPKELDDRRHVTFSHELIHALKDTNPDEVLKAYNMADVLPILVELIIAYSTDDKTKGFVYRERLNATIRDLGGVRAGMEASQLFPEYELGSRLLIMQSGQHVNSFYYALQLFNIYKKKPREILSKIKDVLNKKRTTRDVLEEYGLMSCLNKEVFSDEVKMLKKV